MIKKSLFVIFLFCTLVLQAQDRYFLKSDTRLYTSKNSAGAFLGYFKYGAEIQLLSENENGWYKVKSDNLSEGYVEAKFVSKTLNAADIKIKDKENPIIEGSDNYHGSNHLFVLVAGLKARALPDRNSKVKEILYTGDPVTVNYSPKNPEEWVNINGSLSDEYAQYTLRKFLGERPDFNTLLQNFDQLDVTAISERKTIAERIVELAWNSDPSKLAPAYQRYFEVVKQLNDPKLTAETELNIAIAKGQAKQKTAEEIFALSQNAEFSLKGLKTKSLYTTTKELEKVFGKPSKKATVSDECGIYLSELFYYYADLEASVDEKQNQVEITKVYINENNKLILNNKSALDYSLSEKTFVEKYSTYISASIKAPHHYSLALPDSEFRIEFKDGKLFAIKIFFYC
ncbi:SH3 domain-containing protein [Flavobacterium poyangense]|uniref:SH3 domain-containing protein n=1 Tax=Flavobacterium poyangense TaxID=2204302 RepID=UPI00141EBB7F|nr:SH3 domain-containing protein [Flavobacterium sp. JXAS1]